MEGEALETALAAGRLDLERPARGGEIEIRRDGPAVVADGVDDAAHVVDEQAAGARLIDQPHHARGLAIDVRQCGEFDGANANDAVNRRYRLAERIVARLGARDRGRQQQSPPGAAAETRSREHHGSAPVP